MHILINKKSISQIPIHLRAKEGLGYLPQTRSLFNMSAYDNIFGLCQLHIKSYQKQKEETERLLDEFNLQHLRSLNASVLSGGEAKRLQLARIMINKPKIILIDDDEIDRKMFKKYLNAFPENSFTIVEFEMGEEALEYCSREKPDCILIDSRFL